MAPAAATRPPGFEVGEPGGRGAGGSRQDFGLRGHSNGSAEVVEDAAAPGGNAPLAIVPQCAFQQPGQHAGQPDDGDDRGFGTEVVVVRGHRHGVGDGGAIDAVELRLHLVGDRASAPAGRKAHAPIGGVEEHVAWPGEFEIDQGDGAIRQQHVVGTGIAMDQGLPGTGRQATLGHQHQFGLRQVAAEQGDHLARFPVDPVLAWRGHGGVRQGGLHDRGVLLAAADGCGMQPGQGDRVGGQGLLGLGRGAVEQRVDEGGEILAAIGEDQHTRGEVGGEQGAVAAAPQQAGCRPFLHQAEFLVDFRGRGIVAGGAGRLDDDRLGRAAHAVGAGAQDQVPAVLVAEVADVADGHRVPSRSGQRGRGGIDGVVGGE